jgi:signal transduction histidine kinase
MPVHPELRPWHVIQIVRVLDEALTNAVKHADARCITVSIDTFADASGLARGRITVEDDGKGFAIAGAGDAVAGAGDAVASDGSAAVGTRQAARGLRNMRSRAARCGAELELNSGAGGTSVRLTLPRRFPDSDAVAG